MVRSFNSSFTHVLASLKRTSFGALAVLESVLCGVLCVGSDVGAMSGCGPRNRCTRLPIRLTANGSDGLTNRGLPRNADVVRGLTWYHTTALQWSEPVMKDANDYFSTRGGRG